MAKTSFGSREALQRETIDPAIDRAMDQLCNLGWTFAVKEFNPGDWSIICEKDGDAFYQSGTTAGEVLLVALAKAEEWAKQ